MNKNDAKRILDLQEEAIRKDSARISGDAESAENVESEGPLSGPRNDLERQRMVREIGDSLDEQG